MQFVNYFYNYFYNLHKLFPKAKALDSRRSMIPRMRDGNDRGGEMTKTNHTPPSIPPEKCAHDLAALRAWDNSPYASTFVPIHRDSVSAWLINILKE
jgi:hypothetical protein